MLNIGQGDSLIAFVKIFTTQITISIRCKFGLSIFGWRWHNSYIDSLIGEQFGVYPLVSSFSIQGLVLLIWCDRSLHISIFSFQLLFFSCRLKGTRKFNLRVLTFVLI
ncbi:hypothetical protein FGO68_gene3664 [Halteria grandinella]|uniref:Uncharacterized protein n=1 Tax=Halteria grandinella TaxID=5974 RepID=A0A8J8SXH2_HALGN|nr:hypothetical protein FGO68_gene3664 [Halteria grandinella]